LIRRRIEVSEIYFDKTILLIPQGNIDLWFDTILKSCNLMIDIKLTKGK
jgi:DNA polymerase-3 subunit epsilon